MLSHSHPCTDGSRRLVLARHELEELAMALSAESVEREFDSVSKAVFKLEEKCFALLGYGEAAAEAASTAGVLGYRARSQRKLHRGVLRVPNSTVHRLSVALEDIEPAVTRQLAVRSDTTLEELHAILQVAFGWTESHLHLFRAGDKLYMHEQQDDDMDALPSKSVTLLDVLPEAGARLLYEYDLGDDWRHLVRVRSIDARSPQDALPRCEGGQNSAPPEDVGGAGRYQEFLAAVDDPDHDRHEDFRNWLGRPFDPHAFDLELTNRLLAMLGRCQDAGG